MKKTRITITVVAIALIATMATAMAQDQDKTRDQVRDQLRLRIDQAEQLTDQEREQMRNNLRECVHLGLGPDELAAVFPGVDGAEGPAAQAMIRVQNRVMKMVREGLPPDAVVAKFQEGMLKGVQGPALDGACERMENHVRAAERVMARVHESGNEPAGEPVQSRRMTRELAQQMWRGMGEGDYEHLCEQARQRLRDGSCGLEDIVAGGETATRLLEQGVDRGRAMDIPGDALRKGYGAQEMRHLQFMVMARRHVGPMDDFVTDLEHCLGLGMGMGDMYQHMMHSGWMGPGDMWGPGGFQGGDDRGHGPGHGGDHDGGMHGGERDGGMRGGGQDGGGRGGDGGGNGQQGG